MLALLTLSAHARWPAASRASVCVRVCGNASATSCVVAELYAKPKSSFVMTIELPRADGDAAAGARQSTSSATTESER